MDWFAELERVMPPPAEVRAAPRPEDWAAAEAALGVRFPDDFRRYLEVWGSAYVGGFFFACSPSHPRKAGRLVENAEYVSRALSTLKAHHPQDFTAPVFPQPGGFLAWGRTDNGDFLGWMVTGADPNGWPAAVWGEDAVTPEVFDGKGFGDFIVGVVTGTLRPAAFPQSLWDTVPLTIWATPD